MDEKLQYPIGRFKIPATISADDRERFIAEIVAAPAELRGAVKGLTGAQLDTPYRPGGWTVRQVVHHLPDSHANSYARFMLASTENEPTIRTYEEQLWAELPEAKTGPIEMSLVLLEALHVRWVARLKNLSAADFSRAFVHPKLGRVPLDVALALYAWHGKHHIAHITSLRQREGW